MINVENSQYDLEVLISTMNRTSLSFLSNIFPDNSCSNYKILIVNQTTRNALLKSNDSNIRVINSFDKGLARSRNLAIKNATCELCLFADDDISYVQGFDVIVKEAFARYQYANIITYKMVNYKGELFTHYPNIIRHNKKTVSSVNSVVISFRRKQVIDNKVFFNVNFGLGSTFETADEYVFLRSALKKRFKVFFEGKVLLSHPNFSSGKAVSSDRIVFARSAVFYKYNGILTYLKLVWHLYLLFRNNDLKLNQFYKKYIQGLNGINKYRNLIKQGLEIKEN